MKMHLFFSLTTVFCIVININTTYCASEDSRLLKKQETEDIQSLAGLNALNEDTGQNALHKAITDDDLEEVHKLLSMGVNPNTQNKDGETSLHLAIEMPNSSELIQALLDAHPEIDKKNSDGETPLGHAVESSDVQTMSLLLKAGANPNAPNNQLATPFTLLMSNWKEITETEQLPILQEFFAAKGNPLLADIHGNSAFSKAISNASPEIILFFMQEFPIFTPRTDAPPSLNRQETVNTINASIKYIENKLATLQPNNRNVQKYRTILDMLKHPKKYLTEKNDVDDSLRKGILISNNFKWSYWKLKTRQIGAKPLQKSIGFAKKSSSTGSVQHHKDSFESKED